MFKYAIDILLDKKTDEKIILETLPDLTRNEKKSLKSHISELQKAIEILKEEK